MEGKLRDNEFAVLEGERYGCMPAVLGKIDLNTIKRDIASGGKVIPRNTIGHELFVNPNDVVHPDEALINQIPEGLIQGIHCIKGLEDEKDGKKYDRMFDLTGGEDDRYSQRCEQSVEQTINLAARMKANYVNIHIGHYDLFQDVVKDIGGEEVLIRMSDDQIKESMQKTRNRRLQQSIVRVKRLAKYAQDRGVTLTIENGSLYSMVAEDYNVLTDSGTMATLVSELRQDGVDFGVILDEEHMCKVAVMKPYWDNYAVQYLRLKAINGQVTKKEDEDMRREDLKPYFYERTIIPEINAMFEVVGRNLYALHTCGWDFLRDDKCILFKGRAHSRKDYHMPPGQSMISTREDPWIWRHDTIDHRYILEKAREVLGDGYGRLKIIVEYDSHKQDYWMHPGVDGIRTNRNPTEELADAIGRIRYLSCLPPLYLTYEEEKKEGNREEDEIQV